MNTEQQLERGIIVFCNWAVFGMIGFGFLLEGVARDAYFIGLVGVIGIAAGFAGHMVINSVFDRSFTLGEAALGLGIFSIAVLVFVLSWIVWGHSQVDFYIGLTLLATIVVGFFAYLVTRYGVRGAFTRFDVNSGTRSGRKK